MAGPADGVPSGEDSGGNDVGPRASQLGSSLSSAVRSHSSTFAPPSRGSGTVAPPAIRTRPHHVVAVHEHRGLLGLGQPAIQPTYLPLECTLETLDLLNLTTARIAAHKRQPPPEEQTELARCCLVLSVFETVRRRGERGWPPQFLDGTLPQTTPDLPNAIPAALVADVAALAAAFMQRYPQWHGAPATLNPKFAGAPDVGGADGERIVDGCLWEIKTTIGARAQGAWLYQLLGYVLLDCEADHAIKRAGFLFPRQNGAVHWPLTDLIRELSGRTDLSLPGLRQELRGRLGRDPPFAKSLEAALVVTPPPVEGTGQPAPGNPHPRTACRP